MFGLINTANASTFMPPAGTAIARHVDSLYAFLLWASLISCVLVIGGFIWFSIKYKRKSESDKTAYIAGNHVLEFLWSFIPFIIFMIVFGWGFYIYTEMRTMPKDALEVLVTGQKWNWTFTYKNGKVSAAELYVPVNEPVKLIMASKDVLHSFFIPSFRIKQDVVPGRYTTLWFNAERPGNYQVFCAEYCGENHSGMMAKVHAVSREDFDQWLKTDPYKGLALKDIGEKVYQTRCAICHQLTDQKAVGPSWKGLFGKSRTFSGGQTATADENYIRESILNPNAKVVEGFAPAMPTFAGQLSEQEILGVIELIKSLQ